MSATQYSCVDEATRIRDLILDITPVPQAVKDLRASVVFTAGGRDAPYFPVPLKEVEVTAALKSIEGSLACAIQDLKDGQPTGRKITVDLRRTTAFLFQAYLAQVAGHTKLDKETRKYLKDTDLLAAQSDSYRRMSANLYETKTPGEFYHIHGSLEASTTLGMIGLEPFRPDLKTHEDIVKTIGSKVRQFTVAELEVLNAKNRQAGVPALKHEDFLKTPHGKLAATLPPWTMGTIETITPPRPFPASSPDQLRPLAGIKVLELCRIIAGPVIGRILAEYGATVLKVTSPKLSDVPFFQVDGNMGKHATDLDLKTPEGRATFEALIADADVVLDGYRPGAIEKLGYGAEYLRKLAEKRGYGVVYVNENCFGYQGEWAHRPGWQQIADCVTGVAWAQGKFMNLDEPVVPPFPISDYGTGCVGAIAALAGLYNRATIGGSHHGMASLVQYDMLLFRAGLYPPAVQDALRAAAGPAFLSLRHSHSVDQISGTALLRFKELYPELFDEEALCEKWFASRYGYEVVAVRPVVQIEGVEVSFQRASRPNGSDAATWDFSGDGDYRIS